MFPALPPIAPHLSLALASSALAAPGHVFGESAQNIFSSSAAAAAAAAAAATSAGKDGAKNKRGRNAHSKARLRNPLPSMLLGKANLAFASGDLDTAEAAALELVGHDDKIADAHSLLSMVYEQKGEFGKSYAHELRKLELIEVAFVGADALIECAVKAKKADMRAAAVDLLRRALAMDPRHKQASLLLCDFHIAMGQHQLAIDACQALLESATDTDVLLMEARARAELGEDQHALKILLQVAQVVLAPPEQPQQTHDLESNAAGTAAAAAAAAAAGAANEAPRNRLATDESEVIETGLSALSGAVEILMRTGAFARAQRLIARCRDFLLTGRCANRAMTWSWDLPGARFKQRAVPLDLAVRFAMCSLELGKGLEDAAAACALLGKVPLPLSERSACEELHVELACVLMKRRDGAAFALDLLRRVDLVQPARHDAAHIARLTELLEGADELEYASEVKARSVKIKSALQLDARSVQLLTRPEGRPGDDASSLLEVCAKAEAGLERLQAQGRVLAGSLDGATLRALHIAKVSSDLRGLFANSRGEGEFGAFLQQFLDALAVHVGKECAVRACLSLFQAAEEAQKSIVTLVCADVCARFCNEVAVDAAAVHLPVSMLLREALQSGQQVPEHVWSLARPLGARLKPLADAFPGCDELVELAHPGLPLSGVRIAALIAESNQTANARDVRFRAGLKALRMVQEELPGDREALAMVCAELGLKPPAT